MKKETREKLEALRKESEAKHSVRIGKIRESLICAGYKPCWQGKAGGHDLDGYVGARGVIIVQHLRDVDGFRCGVEVYAPITQANSMTATCDAIEGKTSELAQAVDSVLAGVRDAQRRIAERINETGDATYAQSIIEVPVLYLALARLLAARKDAQ